MRRALACRQRWNSAFTAWWDGLGRAWSRRLERELTSQEFAPFVITPTVRGTQIVFESRWVGHRRGSVVGMLAISPILALYLLLLLWAVMNGDVQGALVHGTILLVLVFLFAWFAWSEGVGARVASSLRIDPQAGVAAIGSTYRGTLREPPVSCTLEHLRIGVHRLEVRIPSKGSDDRAEAFGLVAHIADRRFVLCCLKTEAEVAEYAAILPKAVYERLDWKAEPIQIRVRWSPRITVRGLRPNVIRIGR